jgi:hypothetical protein
MFVRLLGLTFVILVTWVVFARPSSGSGTREPRVYVVRPHDTLWSIASHRYGGDPREAVWNVQQRNGLPTTTLRVGQRLVMP